VELYISHEMPSQKKCKAGDFVLVNIGAFQEITLHFSGVADTFSRAI
jgi:hypothetical protein